MGNTNIVLLKCDEQRPYCVNCTRGDRICSYALESPRQVASATAASSEASSSANSDTSPSARTASSEPPAAGASRQVIVTERFDISASATVDGHSFDWGDGDSINMHHLRLFEHFRGDKFMLASFNTKLPVTDQVKETFIKEALSEPYVMYECLAFAARHLSVEGPPEMASFYLEQAVQLQTRSLAIFNASTPVINEKTCLALFIFSNLLGQHTLVDNLAFRQPSLEGFLSHFLSHIGLHRGARSICTGCWPLLMNSELRPLLLQGVESKPVH